MAGTEDQMVRPSVPEADREIGVKHAVLGHGFVVLVDYMGNDASIVQAARVSYGQGTKSVRDDRGLLRYLMRHRHTTPFEMVEYKFLVRLPIYVARQWVRHRTACLAAGTRVHLERSGRAGPGRRRDRSLRIEEIWRRFQPAPARTGRSLADPYTRRAKVTGLPVRALDEVARVFGRTHIVDVTRNGLRPVFRMTLEDGKWIECTADHRFLFEDGWATLAGRTGLRESNGKADWTPGDYWLQVNGIEVSLAPFHGPEIEGAPWDAGPRADRWIVPRLERLRRFEFLGLRMTYDLEVESPFHNFVANGIVTHNSVNEHSARYSIVPDEYELPRPEDVRRQSARNRQGRGEPVPADVAERFRGDLERLSEEAYDAYTRALEAGIARETARMVLPVSYYTQWYWKINLHNLFHFLSLRLDVHAQEEIRLYAAELARLAQLVAPVAFEAFEEFQLEGLSLSRREQKAVRALFEGKSPPDACTLAGLPIARDDGRPMTTGEGVEFLEKLERIRPLD